MIFYYGETQKKQQSKTINPKDNLLLHVVNPKQYIQLLVYTYSKFSGATNLKRDARENYVGLTPLKYTSMR